ncbi:PAS domain S-box protein [Halorubrum cibi]|uniref:histidine kinase n=1 Tax=Halorubrum cibi TaxID=413815 RepID=A0A521AFI5_9EURY|nr:PAS domain S-box protein [Halorubrum cibi]SMO33470.1 PAS domain S-box-containing protein [Halorubrum cibi]
MTEAPDAAALLDLTNEAVVVVDDRGSFRYLNAAIEGVLGFEPSELVGRDAFALVHPDDGPRIRAIFERAVADGSVPNEPFEYRCRTADGDWIWVRSELFPPEETGVEGNVLRARDVTEEVESRRRLETIVSKSPDVLWMFDADWSELLFVNESVEEVFELTVGELRADPRRFLEVVHADDRPRVERAMARLSAGETTRIDYRIEPSDGEMRWLRVPGEPVFDDDEEVIAVSGFARDVTDEYRRNRQLTVMDNLLRHTIRNDMNVVSGIAERIADRTSDELAADAETVRRVAGDLLETAEKQRDVIDLLGEDGSPRPTPVEPIVSEAIGRVRTRDPNAEFDVSCASEATALAIPELGHAIGELVENAVEHAESPPTVHIEVTDDEDHVEIAVRDTCPPIPVEQRRVITDEWEMDRLRHTVGMGLWLVYWIAERSGGELAFDTHRNGNVVTLTVPSARGEATSEPADPVNRLRIERGRRDGIAPE